MLEQKIEVELPESFTQLTKQLGEIRAALAKRRLRLLPRNKPPPPKP